MRCVQAAALALLALAGCDAVRETREAPGAEDPAIARLVEAVSRAEAALGLLAAAAEPAPAPPRAVPPELMEEITIDWIGPLETAAARLARRAGYGFVEAGRPHPVPLMVTLQADAAPLVLVLRDAGLQAGDAARLTVDAQAREIRLERLEGGGA